MKEEFTIEEMVEMFFQKKWKKRVKNDLVPEERRCDAYFRYNNGKNIIMSFTIAFICIFVLFVAILSVNGRIKDAFLICAIPLLLVIRIWISIGKTEKMER